MDRCLIACPSAGTATSHLVEHAVLTHFHLSVVELIDSSDKKPALHCLSAGFTCLFDREEKNFIHDKCNNVCGIN